MLYSRPLLFIYLFIYLLFIYLIMFVIVVVVESLSHVWLFCYPMDCSLPGSSVHGFSQARILEWVALSFFRGSSQPRDRACIFCNSCSKQVDSLPLRWILYHWTPREAHFTHSVSVNPRLLIYPFPSSCLVIISLISMSVSLFLFCK